MLGGGRGRTGTVGQPRGPQLGPNANRAWGLRRDPLSPSPEIWTVVSKSYRTGGFSTERKRKISGDQGAANLNPSSSTRKESPHTRPQGPCTGGSWFSPRHNCKPLTLYVQDSRVPRPAHCHAFHKGRRRDHFLAPLSHTTTSGVETDGMSICQTRTLRLRDMRQSVQGHMSRKCLTRM